MSWNIFFCFVPFNNEMNIINNNLCTASNKNEMKLRTKTNHFVHIPFKWWWTISKVNYSLSIYFRFLLDFVHIWIKYNIKSDLFHSQVLFGFALFANLKLLFSCCCLNIKIYTPSRSSSFGSSVCLWLFFSFYISFYFSMCFFFCYFILNLLNTFVTATCSPSLVFVINDLRS